MQPPPLEAQNNMGPLPGPVGPFSNDRGNVSWGTHAGPGGA